MNAIEQIQQIKSFLEKSDEKVLDAFFSQNKTLMTLVSETWFQFQQNTNLLEKDDMLVIKPTEKTPIQRPQQIIRFPNAKQDETYCYEKENSLPFFKQMSASPSIDGIIWDSEKQSLVGTPTVSGDITLSFLLEDGSTQIAQLFINPNPKRLWNNIPSDSEKTRFWKEDGHHQSLSTEYGELISARMRGRTHAHKGTCCDDDMEIAYHHKTGMHILVVSDGAGSAEYSRYGSKLAVEAVKNKILELLNAEGKSYQQFCNLITEEKRKIVTNELFKQAVQAAFTTQESIAESETIELKSLSCTLLIAISLRLNDGKWFTACYWVGDGAAAIFVPHTNEVKLLGEVDSGQYSGETQFLTRSEAVAEKLVTRIYTDLRDYPPIVILMTDGVSDPKFQTESNLTSAQAWQTFWQELGKPLSSENPAKSLEEWLDFFSKGEHDDRTLSLFIPSSIWTEISQKAKQRNETAEEILQTEPSNNLDTEQIKTDDAVEIKQDRTLNITFGCSETQSISLKKSSDSINTQESLL